MAEKNAKKPEAKKDEFALIKGNNAALDRAMGRVEDLLNADRLTLPKNYSYNNAMQQMLMVMNKPDKNGDTILKTCTGESIYNVLYDMALLGLTPGKNQCYVIPRRNKGTNQLEATLSVSYFGKVAAAKSVCPEIVNVVGVVVRKGEEFSFQTDLETGYIKILKHNQSLETWDADPVAAYAIVIIEGQDNYVELMTMKQIKAAWNQGELNGNSPAHKNFSDQMIKKTVIQRATKMFLNSSNDSNMEQVATYNKVGENQNESLNKDDYEVIDDENATQEISFKKEPKQEKQPVEKEVKEPEESEGINPFDAPIDDDDVPAAFR